MISAKAHIRAEAWFIFLFYHQKAEDFVQLMEFYIIWSNI